MKRIVLIPLLIFSLLIPLSARTQFSGASPFSQGQSATATKPVAGKPAVDINSRVLSNGLEIVTLEDHSVPLVTIELAVRNGSFTEPPELNGLSHLYEHMFFKANRAIANQEDYLQKIGQLGIAYNGQTREEVVDYYFTTTSPNLRTAMNFMRDAVRYPLFDKTEFEREREVVIGEIDRNESNPFYYLNLEMTNRLFYKYPSRKNPLGNRQTVATATTDMMRLIQSRYYVPNNSALMVTGDVNSEEIFKMAQEFYGDWPKREKDPFVEFPMVEHPPLPKSEGAVVKQPVQNVIFNIGWHGPSIGKDNPGSYAADVFSFILTQPNSRFQHNLVDTGLVNGVTIGYLTQRNVGPIQIVAQTTPDKARAAFLFVKVGLSGADMGALYLLPRIVGLGKATELVYFGDTIDAQEAHRIGLANRVVPGERLMEEAYRWARRLKEGPLYALGVTKELLELEANINLETALEMEAMAQARCMETPDFIEGYKSFMEKRPQQFNRK